jgi:pyruvate formate lyase activating enzyme
MAKPTGGERVTPAQIAATAEKLTKDGNIGVAYTYNEPLIGYEFVLDCAALVHEKGLKNILVTNGYIQREPFIALLPYINALNIDLKGFTDAFYQKVSGSLDTVKENIAMAARYAHVEVTTLIIPRENDGEGEIDALARFLAGVNPEIPLHLSRFFPRHEMTDREPTPVETIWQLKKTAENYLKYVYAGNI